MKIHTFQGGYDNNLTYLVYTEQDKSLEKDRSTEQDKSTKKNTNKIGALIDPAVPAQEIFQFAEENNIKIKLVVVMHSHFDHLAGLDEYLKKNIPIYAHKSIPQKVESKITHKLNDNEIINLGKLKFNVVHTPGHEKDCICLLLENYRDNPSKRLLPEKHLSKKYLFTSDTLFIGSYGRVDLPGSNVEEMAASLERLKELPDSTIILSGHDYGEKKQATLGEEKKKNSFLKASKEEFIRFFVFV